MGPAIAIASILSPDAKSSWLPHLESEPEFGVVCPKEWEATHCKLKKKKKSSELEKHPADRHLRPLLEKQVGRFVIFRRVAGGSCSAITPCPAGLITHMCERARPP